MKQMHRRFLISGLITVLLSMFTLSDSAEAQLIRSKTEKKRTKQKRQQLHRAKPMHLLSIDETEPNNTIPTANPVPLNDYVSAAIDPAGDVDYFTFNVTDSQTVSFDIDADIFGSSMDSYIELYDSAGTLLAENDDDPSSLDSKLIYTFPVHGNYYLKVTELDGNGGEDYYYLLKIFNVEISGISNLNVLTSWPIPNACIGVKKSGRYLFTTEISAGHSRFKIWDISDLYAPVLMDSIQSAGFISNFELYGNYAYLAMGSGTPGLKILDISNPSDIIEDTLIAGPEINNLFRANDTLYTAEEEGMSVYSIAVPDAPALLWHFGVEYESCTSVIADDQYVYLSSTDYFLHIINKTTHSEVGNFNWFNASFMDLKGCELYMSAKEGAVIILNVSDPVNPAELFTIYSEYPGFGLEVHDPYAYFSNGNGGLSVYNISDPENPSLAAYCFSFSDMFVFNTSICHDTIFIASGCVYGWDCNAAANRIYVLKNSLIDVKDAVQSQKPDNITLRQNYPNPFNPSTTIRYELKSGGNVNLKIYNTLGQEVRALFSGAQQAGPHEMRWDGKDNTGRQVTSGVYVYRIQAGDVVKSRKMLLMK